MVVVVGAVGVEGGIVAAVLFIRVTMMMIMMRTATHARTVGRVFVKESSKTKVDQDHMAVLPGYGSRSAQEDHFVCSTVRNNNVSQHCSGSQRYHRRRYI